MKIAKIGPTFGRHLKILPYNRKVLIELLMRKIEAASSIDELVHTANCGQVLNKHFVYDYDYKLYFRLLDENHVKLVNFTRYDETWEESLLPL